MRERIKELLRKGEGLTIEFKRCAGKVEHDVFESICAFLNRFGGDVLLGVENDGTVVGVKPVGKDAIITIDFDAKGTKPVMKNNTRMEKIAK